MSSIAEPLIKLLQNCRNISMHTSLNRVCDFAMKDGDELIKAIQQLEQENERLKHRVEELEQQLKEDDGR